MAIIQNGADISNLMLGTAQIAKVYQGTLIVWDWEVVSVLSGGGSIVYANSLFPDHWDKPNPKRIIVPAGVERGTASALGAIAVMPQGSNPSDSFAGSLTIEIAGTVSGIGGTANSGVGGNAILANFLGRDGQKLILNNHGTIRAGGGGGGRGGDGGAGQYGYIATEGPYWSPYTTYNWYDRLRNGYWTRLYWGGSLIHDSSSGTSSPITIGGYNYYRGALRESIDSDGFPQDRHYEIYRTYTAYQSTTGGTGGNGGRGQGFDGALAAGANGAAGGTNAGAGGKGGDGGAFGQSGATGATGASGNVGAGLAGAAGGLAGFYLNGAANVTLNNYGTLLGRVA